MKILENCGLFFFLKKVLHCARKLAFWFFQISIVRQFPTVPIQEIEKRVRDYKARSFEKFYFYRL